MTEGFHKPASNQVEEIQEEMLYEIDAKKHPFTIQKSRMGIPKIKTSDSKIIIYGIDEQQNNIFIKFPFPARADVNKRQTKRVYTLANKLEQNPHLPRIRGTRPITIAGIQGVISEEGLYSLKDFLDDPRHSRKQKITIAREAIAHGALAMEILHRNGVLVCDYKDSNTVFYEDKQWGLVDPESFKPIGQQLLDEETIEKLYKSTGTHTESFLDWMINLDDIRLTTESDRYTLGCVLFKAYFDYTPQTLFRQEGHRKTVTTNFIKEKINQIPDKVDQYFLLRTLGQPTPEGPLPKGKKYTDFRFSDIKEAREILQKRTVIYFEKDLEQPEYQTFLKCAKQLKDTIQLVDKKRGGLEETLTIEAAEKFRTHYQAYIQAYQHHNILTVPQREEVHENIQEVIEPFLEEEYTKLERIVKHYLPQLQENKLRTELWDVYAKSEILGYNTRQEHVPLENITKLTNDRILRMKVRIDNIK